MRRQFAFVRYTHSSPLRQPQFLQTPFQVLPRSQARLLRRAHRLRLVRAQKYVVADVFDLQLLHQLGKSIGRIGCFHALILAEAGKQCAQARWEGL